MAPSATEMSTPPTSGDSWGYAPKIITPKEDMKLRRPDQRIPQSLIDKSKVFHKQAWHPDIHLEFVPPTKKYTMKEIGLEGRGISKVAVSEPFQLFSREAIRQMRAEAFTDKIVDKYAYRTSFVPSQLQGHCPHDSPFISSAWYDPKTLQILSEVAGVELVPSWDMDVGNINVTIPPDKEDSASNVIPPAAVSMQDNEAVGWHYDCVPFVCVMMMSDCTNMVGGETMIRLGDGSTMKMRGPSEGTAVLMQGRYIEHKALKAMGGQERITMVTSLRPKNPLIKDESVLAGVRGNSPLPEIMYQYVLYRAEILEERMKEQQKSLIRRHRCHQDIDVQGTRRFLQEQRDYINQTLEDLVED